MRAELSMVMRRPKRKSCDLSHKTLSHEEAEGLIAGIVQRTRQHPLLSRGASVRASLAAKEISKGYEHICGKLDRITIEKATLLTLPKRVIVKPSIKKNGYEIIQEINQEVLYGITSLEYEAAFKDSKRRHASGPAQDDDLIEELVDFQKQQFSAKARIKNLHADFMRRQKAGEKLSADKVDCRKLETRLHDFEKQGIIHFDDIGDGYTLQGAALLFLLENIIDKDLSIAGSRPKKQHSTERSYIRRHIKGDPYRDVSPRHTIKRLIRRGKSIVDVCISDIRCFEKIPQADRDIAVCIDVSESMKHGVKLRYAKIAAAGIAKAAIARCERVGVVVFSNSAEIVNPLTKKLHKIADALVHVQGRRYTNVGDGIKKGRELLLKDQLLNRKLIIIISDGLPNLTSENGDLRRETLHADGEMDNFAASMGSDKHDQTNHYGSCHAGVQLMFRNIIASEYALKEAKKSRARDIKTSFLYIGGDENNGEFFAKKIAKAGCGRFYNVKNIQDLPGKALALIR